MSALQARVTEAKLPDRLFLLHSAGGGALWEGVVYVRSRCLFMTSDRAWPPGNISPQDYIVIFIKPRVILGLHFDKL